MSNTPTLNINLTKALLAAQRKMAAVTKDSSNPYYKSKYADVNAFLDEALPTLNELGVVVLQPTYTSGTEHYVQTVLIHESGEQLSYPALKLELKTNDMQQLGAAITYARRFQLQSLLAMKAVDDDAESTMNRSKKETKAPVAGVTHVPISSAGGTESQATSTTITSTLTTPEAAPKPRSTFRKSSAPASNGAVQPSNAVAKTSLNF